MRPICLIAVFLPLALSAADKTYVLKAARMFDGKSDGAVAPGLVVVTGNRIAGLGAGAAVPAGAEAIELGDATLLPGLMDAHTHLSMPFEMDYRNGILAGVQKPVAERALDAAENARATLMAGVTTVRDDGARINTVHLTTF